MASDPPKPPDMSERKVPSPSSKILGKRPEPPAAEAESTPSVAADSGRLGTEAVHIIAQSLPHNINLTDAAAAVLAPDAEYRLREIIQDSVKFMKHSKRYRLAPEHINSALRLRNVAPMYGFGKTAAPRTAPPLIIPNGNGSRNCPRPSPTQAEGSQFHTVEGSSDLFFTADKEVNLKTFIEAELPPLPLEVSVAPHWLAINGVQPAIPQNPLPRSSEDGEEVEISDVKKEDELAAGNADVKPTVKHVLSKELQLYFDHVTESLAGSDGPRIDACLTSIAEEPGLVQLLPYFTLHASETVRNSMQNLPVLLNSARLIRSLITNPNFRMESYLHQLLPTILSCIVARRLYMKPRENHWKLRDYSARILQDICIKYREKYPNIQTRVTKTLLDAFRDPKKSLTTHYGAIMGLSCLGKHVVDGLLFPHVGDYMNLVKKVLDDPKLKAKSIRRYEAAKVMGALGFAVATSGQSQKEANDAAKKGVEVFVPDFSSIPEELQLKLPSDFVSRVLAVEKEFGKDVYPQQSNDNALLDSAK